MAGRFVHNFLGGTTTDNPLTAGATTINSANFANLPAISASNTMALVLDPDGSAGTPEIVLITAHTASATSVTVTRGQETSTGASVARQHAAGTEWVVGFTALDFEELPFRKLTTTGDILYASAANVASRLAIGAATTVLHGGTTPSYSQIVAGDIASDAVTTAKILDSNVTTAKIADANVTTAKLESTIQAVLAAHGCILTDTGQSFTGSALGSITWGSESYDTHSYHAAGSATITIPSDGFYIVSARCTRASGNWGGTASYMSLTLSSGGSWVFPGTAGSTMCGTAVLHLAGSSTFTVDVYNGGATVNGDSTLYVAKITSLT